MQHRWAVLLSLYFKDLDWRLWCFITNDPTGIYDAEPINESIEAANSLMKAKISVRRMLSSNKGMVEQLANLWNQSSTANKPK